MKQDDGMFYFFACPDHHVYVRICPSAELSLISPPGSLNGSCFGVRYSWVGLTFNSWSFLYIMHHTMRPVWVVLHQFQLICLFLFRPDGHQHHNMKWCRQCTRLFSHHLLQLLMVCIVRVYIAQKNEKGGEKNSMCHKKYQNPVSHLRSGPIHISRVWYT